MGILSARDADVYDVMVLDSATFAATVGLGAYLPLNDLLNEKGFVSVSLGSRILRAETAVMFVLSVIEGLR